VELDAFLPLQSVSKFSISRQGKMLMSNMLPAFHVFKGHKMEETSNEFGKFSVMLLPFIVSSFDTTRFPEKLMLFRLLNSTKNVMTSHP
jgi:hypothetical protein